MRLQNATSPTKETKNSLLNDSVELFQKGKESSRAFLEGEGMSAERRDESTRGVGRSVSGREMICVLLIWIHLLLTPTTFCYDNRIRALRISGKKKTHKHRNDPQRAHIHSPKLPPGHSVRLNPENFSMGQIKSESERFIRCASTEIFREVRREGEGYARGGREEEGV